MELGRQAERWLRWLDRLEKLILLVFFGGLVVSAVPKIMAGDWFKSVLLLCTEVPVLIFVLLRRPAQVLSVRWWEWLVAMVATVLPLLVRTDSQSLPEWLQRVVLVLWFLGFLLQFSAKVSLGRSFGCVPALRGVKVVGPYRWVRHPMYAGYLLNHLAIFVTSPSLHNAIVYVCFYGLQIARIVLEEKLLLQDEGYRQYQEQVRFRMIPGVF